MNRREFVRAVGALGVARAGSAPAQTPDGAPFDIKRFGAAGEDRQLDTVPIQRAVDACAAAGGGTVYFPPGRYRSGTIRLRDRVKLHLAEGATLSGSTDLKDYPPISPKIRSYTDTYTDKSLIYAEGLSGVGLEGGGTIDGRGASFQGPYKVRPYMLRFIECRGVSVRDIELKDSPMWVQHYLACEDVRITGIRVRSRVNANNDGIDIDASSAVRISDCHIVSGDDAIVLKSTTNRPCRDVVVANCVVSSLCNGLKLGTESTGGFDNIAFSNCTIYDTRLSGIALEEVDGGILERVLFSNIAMRNVNNPLFVRLGNRARLYTEGAVRPGVGALRNVVIEGVQASGAAKTGCPIVGLPEHAIENLTLRDIGISFAGGGTEADAGRTIPELPENYPEYTMFGVLPSYGLYCRHVSGLQLGNVRCRAESRDARPAMVCDRVERLTVDGFDGTSTGAPLIRLNDVRDSQLRGLGAPGPKLVEVRGPRSDGISFSVRRSDAVAIAGDVREGSVVVNDR